MLNHSGMIDALSIVACPTYNGEEHGVLEGRPFNEGHGEPGGDKVEGTGDEEHWIMTMSMKDLGWRTWG